MPTFIQPSVTQSHRNYIGQHKNNPVNIDLCTELIAKDENDGYGTLYPVIIFKGCNVTWYYGEKNQKARDEQYQQILETYK